MKKIRIILVCILIMLSCTAMAQASVFSKPFGISFISEDGFTTIITDKSGIEYNISGVPDTDSFESAKNIGEVASYEIFYNEKSIIYVELNGVEYGSSTGLLQGSSTISTKSGYYAISLSDIGTSGTEQAFLAGLSLNNITKAQTTIINAAKGNSIVNVTDFEFIDAEKQYSFDEDLGWEYDESDESLCWAGASSNILTYTGWAEKAGIGSTDWMFDYFTSRFNDEGGWYNQAFSYFFNGYNPEQYSGSGAAVVNSDIYGEDYLGELTKYPYEKYYNEYLLYQNPEKIFDVAEDLQNGYGAGLTIHYYSGGELYGAHAITMWGYVYDTSKTDKDAWKAIIISDSDSDETDGENRRTAVNQYTYLPLTSCTYNWYDTWSIAPYKSGQNWYIYSVDTLAPYDESDQGETMGTGNRFAYSDLIINSIQMDTVSGMSADFTERSVFSYGDDLYMFLGISNNGNVDFANDATGWSMNVEIFNSEGTLVRTIEESNSAYIFDVYGYNAIHIGSSLDPGEYTAIASFSLDCIEANYTNNSKEFKFTILSTSKEKKSLSVSLDSSGKYYTYVNINSFSKKSDVSRYLAFAAYGESSNLSSMSYSWENMADTTNYFNKFAVDTKVYSSEEYVFVRVLEKPKTWGGAWTEYIVSKGEQQQYYLLTPKFPSGVSYKTYSPIRVGDTKLSNNEKIAFNIANWSTKGGEVDYTWTLYALHWDDDGEEFDSEYKLKDGSGSLTKGNQIADDITISSFDSYWIKYDINDIVADDYYLYVQVDYTDAAGDRVSDGMYVGDITVLPEKGDLPIIQSPSDNNIENYDINIVGITAKAYAEKGSSAQLAIEYGKTKDQTQTRWGNKEWEETNNTVVEETIVLYNLEPVTEYYYRVIGWINGQRYEGDWSTFSTKSITSSITLGETEGIYLPTISLTRDNQKYYKFTTGDEAGYYTITGTSESGSSNYGIYLYDPNKEEHWSGTYGDGSSQTIYVYLEANRTYYVGIDAYSNGYYKLKITKHTVDKNFTVSFGTNQVSDNTITAKLNYTMPLGSDIEYGIKVKYDGVEHPVYYEAATVDYETDSLSFEIDQRPDTAYTYWGYIKDLKTETEYTTTEYNASAWSFGGEELSQNVKTNNFAAGTKKKYYVAAAEEDAEYMLYCVGNDAIMKVWTNDGVGKWEMLAVNPKISDDDAIKVSLKAGEKLYITLDVYATGDYTICYDVETFVDKIRNNINKTYEAGDDIAALDVNEDGVINETDVEYARTV